MTGAAEQDRYRRCRAGIRRHAVAGGPQFDAVFGELRAGYEISPALTPFIETEIGRRLYDLTVDSAGYARSSDLYAARAGLALDLGEKLSGRGHGRLGSRGRSTTTRLIADLRANHRRRVFYWSPVRGTIVDLIGSTTVEDTTTAGESGSILYAGSLALKREMRANLTGNAVLGAGWRDYTGIGRPRPDPQRRSRPDLVAEPLCRPDRPRPAREA